MTLAEFKKLHNITSLGFYPSKSSKRMVSSLPNGQLVVTTETFTSSSPAFVYTVEPSADNELDNTIHVVSNKEPKAPSLVL